MAIANLRPTAVRGLGEIALRVNDLAAMQHFYEQIIGLPLMTRFPNSAFFKIAEGYGGHTQVLALFALPEFRLSRDGRRNFHHRPHRFRNTSYRFRERKEKTGGIGVSSRNR